MDMLILTRNKKQAIVLIIIMLTLLALACRGFCSDGQGDQGDTDDFQRGLDLFKQGYYQLIPEGKPEEGKQRLEQAISALETAISINGRNIEAHDLLARIYVVLNKYQEASQAYNRVIELNPENIDNYLYLAAAYVQMKEYKAAYDLLNYAKDLTDDKQVIGRIESLVHSIEKNEE